MISIILPTRKRPHRLKSFVDSAVNKAAHPENLEFLVYADDDDPASVTVMKQYRSRKEFEVKIFQRPQMGLNAIQNFLYKHSTGDIIGYFADDVRFLSNNWDIEVRKTFVDDMIYLVCPYEEHNKFKNASHGFVSRRATDAIGELMPSCLKSLCSDKWLEDVYHRIGRIIRLRSVHISHDHPGFSTRRVNPKPELAKYWDETYNSKKNKHGRSKLYKRDLSRYHKNLSIRQEWSKKIQNLLGTIE